MKLIELHILQSFPVSCLMLELAAAANASYIVMHNSRDFAGVETLGIEALPRKCW